MELPYNQCLLKSLLEYIGTLDMNNLPPKQTIEAEAIYHINAELKSANISRDKGQKYKLLTTLPPILIAVLVMKLYHVRLISFADANTDPSYDPLGIYQSRGPGEGTYVTFDAEFYKIARAFNPSITTREKKEFMEALRDIVDRVTISTDPDLIPVNNGIYNYKTNELLPFSPDVVFLNKSPVDFVLNAHNVTIYNPDDGTSWDVESWMAELSDDPEVVDLLWKLLGAVLRPNVPWDKMVLLYSTQGNNGKGTLCEIMRQLLGQRAYASISIAQSSKKFALEPLLGASAIITDENSVGEFHSDLAGLKAITTNDTIQVDRKFKQPINFRFHGLIVQCINDLPRTKDKSESFYRRQLTIPMTKCFTGMERKYIKADYLHRPDVLEYILWRVLTMNYYSLPEPAACRAILDEYREHNDPVRQFALEILPQCKWDLLPFTFLYDLYKSWFQKNSPSGRVQGRNTFISDVMDLLPSLPDWSCPGKDVKIRSQNRMNEPELLIIQYDLTDWMNPSYTGGIVDRRCTPLLRDSYRGLLRVIPRAFPLPTDDTRNSE